MRYLIVSGGDGYQTVLCESRDAAREAFVEAHWGTKAPADEAVALRDHFDEADNWETNPDIGPVRLHCSYEDGYVDVIALTDERRAANPTSPLPSKEPT